MVSIFKDPEKVKFEVWEEFTISKTTLHKFQINYISCDKAILDRQRLEEAGSYTYSRIGVVSTILPSGAVRVEEFGEKIGNARIADLKRRGLIQYSSKAEKARIEKGSI